MKVSAARAEAPVTLTIELSIEEARELVDVLGAARWSSVEAYIDAILPGDRRAPNTGKPFGDGTRSLLNQLTYSIFDKLDDATK